MKDGDDDDDELMLMINQDFTRDRMIVGPLYMMHHFQSVKKDQREEQNTFTKDSISLVYLKEGGMGTWVMSFSL